MAKPVVTEAPLRLANEQLVPDKAYLVGDEDTEDMILILLYRET